MRTMFLQDPDPAPDVVDDARRSFSSSRIHKHARAALICMSMRYYNDARKTSERAV